MKNHLLLAACLLVLVSNAQTTFSVAQATPALPVTANATIDISTTASSIIARTMHVQNTGTNTQIYNVKKYDLVLHATATTTAESTFAFGGCDYGPSTTTGFCTLTLTAGQNSSSLGLFYSLLCNLEEANTIGYSVVKYTIYNINQVSDSLQFTLRYNYQQQATGLYNLQQSNLISLQPNPAKDFARLQINCAKASNACLYILDIRGTVVLAQENTLQTGENTIALNLQDLSPGLYFLKLQNQETVLSRKFVVE